MPNVCQICISGRGPTIDAVHAAGGRTFRSISKEFGFHEKSVSRHLAPGHRRLYGSAVPAGVDATRLRSDAGTGDFVPTGPVETFERAFGFEAMDHQVRILEGTSDLLLLKGRQLGATQAVAGLAIHTALTVPASDSVIVSPSMAQSTEVTRRARLGAWELGVRLLQDSASTLRFDNGSRIVSRPGTARSVRGFSAALLVIDEASWVPDDTWVAAQPTTSATGGRTIVQSTGGLSVGWFYDLWESDDQTWERMRVRSDEAPNVDPEFLARKRREMKPDEYDMEFGAAFGTVGNVGSLWTEEMWRALARPKHKE